MTPSKPGLPTPELKLVPIVKKQVRIVQIEKPVLIKWPDTDVVEIQRPVDQPTTVDISETTASPSSSTRPIVPRHGLEVDNQYFLSSNSSPCSISFFALFLILTVTFNQWF